MRRTQLTDARPSVFEMEQSDRDRQAILRMQDASLPLEISRLYVDLADRIIARDEEGTRRIYYELLSAGRPLEILADAIRFPALRKTLEPALFGEFEYSLGNRDVVALCQLR